MALASPHMVLARPGNASGRGSCRLRALAPRDILFCECDPVRFAYLVEHGLIMLHRVLSDGRRQIIDIVGPGELCSWENGPTHSCTAEALTACSVHGFDPIIADEALEQRSDLARAIRGALLRLQTHILLLGRKSAIERVASLLCRLAELFPEDAASGKVPVPLTRREIADYLGMTQETVSRSLTELRRQGVICHQGRDSIGIKDIPALDRIASG